MDHTPSRRRILTGTLALAAVGALAATPARAYRTTKATAGYTPDGPAGRTCHGCQFYQPKADDTGACALVRGPVDANGSCMLWAAT